ncbi:hypothetical protein [Alkaliphilus sp. B6464]|uniref:hypothetical protein n=1 Tax=Alkaliphilus sp. B6464 TaxID=2731219 RepID=UPI001BA4B748|nr:hypothetical protein [Alkaliphilus sp. B6464]QUH19856.1 hypothetical protein HYG84_08020 [Alkaliphilus sp. B6464]
MDKRSKTMIIVTIFLLFLLIIKSTVIDPVGELVGDSEKYRLYTLQTSPLNGGLLEKAGLLTYRVVKVKQDSIEGNTEVLLKIENSDEWTSDILEGQYSGKVRAYLFYFIPVKDINFRGGFVKDEK